MTTELKQEYIPRILTFGLVISCISIIFSVDYLFNNHKYAELAITTALFAIMCILIRRLNK